MTDKKKQNCVMEQQHILSDGGVLPLLHFPLLSQTGWLKHCFTTREGGCSEGIYESLNLSFTRGDDPARVMQNYQRVAEYFGTDPAHMVTSDQTHTTNVRLVTAEDGGKGITRSRDYRDIDGMITQEPGVVLATFYADCVPLYFADTAHKAIGLSHSGWRGTLHHMAQKTIDAMREAFGTRPQDLLCVVGPSICRECYEVGEDVAAPFLDALGESAGGLLMPAQGGKYHLDLWGINERWLLEAGVPRSQIEVAGLCTCCNSGRLFSHRASQGRRGNLGAFMMIQ